MAASLAHELGHVVNWMSNRTILRGTDQPILKRLRGLNDMKSFFVKENRLLDDRIQTELQLLSLMWRPWDKAKLEKEAAALENENKHAQAKKIRESIAYRDSGEELYADALSAILVQPGLVEQHAPTFYNLSLIHI